MITREFPLFDSYFRVWLSACKRLSALPCNSARQISTLIRPRHRTRLLDLTGRPPIMSPEELSCRAQKLGVEDVGELKTC